MTDETEIRPLSQWPTHLHVFFASLRYHGLNRAERAEGDSELLDLLENRLRLERGRTIRDLNPDVVREFVQQVEQHRRGRWEVVGSSSGDIFNVLDRHFQAEQSRGVAERAREQAQADVQAAGRAQQDAATALYLENATRRTWGLPELQPATDDPTVAA